MASNESKAPEPTQKDWWDKADIVLKPVGALATALVIAVIGFSTSSYLRDRDASDQKIARERGAAEQKIRLYSDLMSRREQAETQLRSEMLSRIVESFVKPEKALLPAQILNLELLVHNFDESLDLAPLFYELDRKIRDLPQQNQSDKMELTTRLDDLAREVGRKQVLALAPRGDGVEFFFEFEPDPGSSDSSFRVRNSRERKFQSGMTPSETADPKQIGTTEFVLGDHTQKVTLYLDGADFDVRELKIRMWVQGLGGDPPTFRVGFFDFPMIENTRLPYGYRLAVLLNELTRTPGRNGAGTAKVTVLAFPEVYAGLKDRPFLQDVLNSLQPKKAPSELGVGGQ